MSEPLIKLTDIDKGRLDIFRMEYLRVCDEIRSIESNNDKVLRLAITLIGAGFLYGIKSNLMEMYYFMPFAIAGVFSYGVLQYYFIYSYGGYKKNLERNINNILRAPVLIWEDIVETRPRYNIVFFPVIFVYIIILIFIDYYCLDAIIQQGNIYITTMYLLSMCAFIVLLLFSISKLIDMKTETDTNSREYQIREKLNSSRT